MCEACREYKVEAEVFIAGLDAWLRTQSPDLNEVLIPPNGLAKAAALTAKIVIDETNNEDTGAIIILVTRAAYQAGIRAERDRAANPVPAN